MSYHLLSITRPTCDRQPRTLIHTLDNDSLLQIFSFFRPVILDETEAVDASQILEGGEWNQERWWYKVVQVCRRWRYLILDSASHLRLSLVCAPGTLVTDMLAHSPPLPLIIDYLDENDDIDAKDEEGLIYALQQRDRVRRIRILKPVPILEKLIINLDGEFPILEYLFIARQQDMRPVTWCDRNLNLPESFQAPNLRHLLLQNFTIPIGSPLFTTMGNLVTLSLNMIPSFAYFHPNALLQRLSVMPQLEIFGITFDSYFPSGDIERQLSRTPITMRVTLPSLRWFAFQGASAYLEALLPRVTIPLLERLQVRFFNQLTYSIPNLQHLMSSTGNLRLNNCTLTFAIDFLVVRVYPHNGTRILTLEMTLSGEHLDWQVACAAQVFHMLRARISMLEHLTLQYRRYSISSEWNNEADRAQWRELLGSFDKVNTLHIDDELVGQLSRSLRPSEGESPTELLPELQELSYSTGSFLRDAFTSFVDARRNAGRPIAVLRRD
jgi:hypothetical protein